MSSERYTSDTKVAIILLNTYPRDWCTVVALKILRIRKMSLLGKLSLVTGSTSGIGLGVAKALAKHGSNIIMNGFGSEMAIKDAMAEIENTYNVQVKYSPHDLENVGHIEDMMKLGESNGGIDILVNNAGIQHVAPTDQFSVDAWNKVLAINLTAAFHTTRLALPIMKQKGWGRIINVASVHGLVGSVNKSAYVASKHGVIGLTKVVALENADSNITCNAICPGWVLTPLVQKQVEDRANALNISFEEAKFKLLSEKQPSAQFVTPEQLGELAVFLSTDAASQVRGVAWQMDGAWTAQ